MLLQLADRNKGTQYMPVQRPKGELVTHGNKQRTVSPHYYRDPIDGKDYPFTVMKFHRNRCSLVSPWAIVKALHLPHFNHPKYFYVLDDSVPEAARPSFNAMDKDQKRTFIYYLIGKEFPKADIEKLLREDPTHIVGAISGDNASLLSVEELGDLNAHMRVKTPKPKPAPVIIKDPSELINALEGGSLGLAASQETKAMTGRKTAPKAPEIAMPEKHITLPDGAMICAGCGKTMKTTRSHKHHLRFKPLCHAEYPEEYFPRIPASERKVRVRKQAPA